MLFPHSHTWTQRQKGLIVGSVVLALASFGALVYGYERYYRGPGESALYGTWVDPIFSDDTQDTEYWEFRSDHTFAIVMVINSEKTSITEGRWYAGGPNIYLRFPEDWGPRRPSVMQIVDISPDQFTVRFPGHSRVYLFQRATLDSPHASNQTIQRTAARCAITFLMIKALPFRLALAPGSRR